MEPLYIVKVGGIYEELAKRTISTDNRKAQEVAHEIVSYVKS